VGGHPFALNALYIEYNALAYYGLLIDVGFYHPIASTPLQQWSLHHFQFIQNNAESEFLHYLISYGPFQSKMVVSMKALSLAWQFDCKRVPSDRIHCLHWSSPKPAVPVIMMWPLVVPLIDP